MKRRAQWGCNHSRYHVHFLIFVILNGGVQNFYVRKDDSRTRSNIMNIL